MQERLRRQYKDDANLNARIQLHVRFSTSPIPWQRWIFDQLYMPPCARILELGCGPGDLWVQNQERLPSGWQITLTDFSVGMLEAAQNNLRDVERRFSFNNVDAQDIPFDDGSFDAVIANHMLYHVPNLPRALSEIRRVLKIGGWFYASTVGQMHMGEMWALLYPFAPHLLESHIRSAMSFTLENGASQLAQVFSDVQRIDYDDNLEITDSEAVIEYLHSSTTLADFTFTGAAEDYVRAQVNAAIAACGAFHVTKASGLFTATAEK